MRVFFPKQELLGSSLQKKKERAWRDGRHAARELGARGVWMGGTRLWSCGAAEFACWMGGTWLRIWGPAVLDHGCLCNCRQSPGTNLLSIFGFDFVVLGCHEP